MSAPFSVVSDQWSALSTWHSALSLQQLFEQPNQLSKILMLDTCTHCVQCSVGKSSGNLAREAWQSAESNL
jgi:hypothetical protein